MKTSTLVASLALFGLLGLFNSGCSDSTLACSEVDSGAADGAGSGGPDLAGGNDSLVSVADAPGPGDAADGPAAGQDGGAGDGGGDDGASDLGSVAGDGGGDDGAPDLGSVAGDAAIGDGGLDLGSVAGDAAIGLDSSGSGGPDAQVGVEAGGADSAATTDAGSTTDS